MQITRGLSARFRVFSIATGLQVTPGALPDRKILRRIAPDAERGVSEPLGHHIYKRGCD